MDAEQRADIVVRLVAAFGAAEDVSADGGQPLHVLLSRLELPEPWHPSPSRALTIWEGWPGERPRFVIDHGVVGENGEPPRSNDSVYLLGEAWRQFSFTFPWVGQDPVVAIQLWMERFTVEQN
jgi:hypothetical protein